jgi:hypothetical protein
MHFSNLSLLHSLSREDAGCNILGKQLVQCANRHRSCVVVVLYMSVHVWVFALEE